MSESSTRLPENEVGGHPQTGEGAVRKPDIPESVVAGDPTLAAEIAAVPPAPVEQPAVVEPTPPIDAPPPAPADPAPLIPPVVPADSQES